MRQASAGWFAASLLVHLGLVASLPAWHRPGPPVPLSITIDVATAPQGPPPTTAITAVPRERPRAAMGPADTERPPATAPRRAPPTHTRTRPSGPSSEAQPARASHGVQPSPAQPSAPAAPIDVSPQAVAREQAGEAPAGAPTAPAPQAPSQGEGTGDPAAGAERLNRILSEAARNPAISEAPDPELKRGPDGSYTFHGNGFDATIDPHGQVHFHDRYLEGVPIPLGGSFDLTAWAEHLAGNDPFRSERRWFFERTERLRAELQAARLAKLAKLTGKALERELASIWVNPQLSAARRRQRTLELWDAAGQSTARAASREAIEAFVRERCPVGAACAFTREELDDFNASRPAGERFLPYPEQASP